jgi:hypothetical protein
MQTIYPTDIFTYLNRCKRNGSKEMIKYIKTYKNNHLSHITYPLTPHLHLVTQIFSYNSVITPTSICKKEDCNELSYNLLNYLMDKFTESFNPLYIDYIDYKMVENENIELLMCLFNDGLQTHLLYAFPMGDYNINNYIYNNLV